MCEFNKLIFNVPLDACATTIIFKNLEMRILPHYYCGECMIWEEDGEWTDGVDYWDSRGKCINYG